MLLRCEYIPLTIALHHHNRNNSAITSKCSVVYLIISESPESRLVPISIRAISMHKIESREISNRKYLSKTILNGKPQTTQSSKCIVYQRKHGAVHTLYQQTAQFARQLAEHLNFNSMMSLFYHFQTQLTFVVLLYMQFADQRTGKSLIPALIFSKDRCLSCESMICRNPQRAVRCLFSNILKLAI